MRALARAGVREHRGGFVGMFVAVLCAAMLVTGLGVLIESGIRGGVPPQRYTGADVVVGAPQSLDIREDIDPALPERVTLPAGVVDELAALPGVGRTVPDTTVPLSWAGRPVQAHGWSAAAITPYDIRQGRPPESPDEVVVDDHQPAGVGDRIPLAHGGIGGDYTVVGVASAHSGDTPDRAAHVFVTDARAAELSAHPGTVDAVAVTAAEGTSVGDLVDEIHRAAPELDVRTGAARGDVEFLDSGAARSELVMIGTSFAGTAVMIAMFVVATTLSLMIAGRRREFALLRGIGATSRQIHRLVGHEVLLVGAVAAALGTVPGYLLAGLLRSRFAAVGMLPTDFGLAYSPLPAVAAIVLSVLTARVAAAVAARRPARLDPVDSLREAAATPATLGRGRVITGLVLGALGLGTSMLPAVVPGPAAVAGAASSAVLLMVAVGLLGPRLVAVAVTVIGRPLRWSGRPALFLAAANTDSNARRLASAITPLALAIGLGCVQVFAQTTVAAEATHQSREGVTADFLVTAPGSGLSPDVGAAVAGLPGVAAATPITRSQVLIPHGTGDGATTERYALQGVDPATTAETMDLTVIDGSLDGLAAPDTVALSTDAAQTIGARVSETVDLHLGDGTPVAATVVATYGRGLGFGDVTMANAVVRAHTTSGLDDSILVRTEPGRQSEVRQELTAAGLDAADRAALGAAGEEQRDAQSWTSLIALAVLLGYLAVAVVNTLVMSTVERGREFTLLRLVGSSGRQVRAMMRAESVIVVLIASVVGTLIALPPLVGVSMGISGQPVPAISPSVYGAFIAATAVLGVLAITIPTRVAVRRA
ncbi:ABC transporter transmembrane protein [Rhodococcus sp. RD6.2]|uniref:ABC transporter permease n=1 Tax=Rhodococcus sp. RD6.2 TaxID=260936 RepID=UPI00063B2367|nr:FtsX-like permease family protein [Rhodococcus sp. RD6.2]CRK54211.1 ABC transporter transmembrane protein [Rhodococcus sp. RD6.2]